MSPDPKACELAAELDLFALGALPSARGEAVRLHLEQCGSCRDELVEWQALVDAADDRRERVMAATAPEEEALAAFWASVATAGAGEVASSVADPGPVSVPARGPVLVTGPEPVPVVGASRLASRPHPVSSARAARWLAVAGLLFFAGVIALPFTWLQPAQQPLRVAESSPVAPRSVDGVREIDLTGWARWDLLARDGELLLRDGVASMRLMQGAQVTGSVDVTSGARRISVQAGTVALRSGTEPLVIDLGGVEATMDADSAVTVSRGGAAAEDESRIRIGVREGRAILRDLARAAEGPGIGGFEVVAGRGVSLTTGGKLPPFPTTDLRDPRFADLPDPPALPREDDPGDALAREEVPGAPQPPGGLGLVDTSAHQLPAGTVQILLPAESFQAGDVVPVQVLVGTAELELGGYYLKLDFQPRDSDLVVELVRPLSTHIGGVAGTPLLQSFDAGTQVLRVADTNTRSLEPIGRGTFLLLSIDVRILAGSPGLHTVGGTVHQLLDVGAHRIVPARIEVKNSISIRRP